MKMKKEMLKRQKEGGEGQEAEGIRFTIKAVSDTHLTLPTNREGEKGAVAVSGKKTRL